MFNASGRLFRRGIALLLFAALSPSIQAAKPAPPRTLQAHASGDGSIVFSPSGRLIASISWDGTVKIWNARTLKLLRILSGFDYPLTSIAFCPDGMLLATGSSGKYPGFVGEVKLWNAQTGQLVRALPTGIPGTAVAFSPNGDILATGGGNSARLWDAHTGKPIRRMKAQSESLTGLAFSPDGATFAVASFELAGSLSGAAIELWDVRTGKHGQTFWGGPPLAFAFSPDGKTLAYSTRNPLEQKEGGVTITNKVMILDYRTGKTKRDLNSQNVTGAIAYSPDGKTIATGSVDGVILLRDLTRKNKPHTLRGPKSGITTLAYSPNGDFLASAADDGTITLWPTR